MPDEMSLTLTNGPKIERALRQLGKDVEDGTDVLKQLDRTKKARLTREMNNVRADRGGKIAGRRFKGMAPQYVREDGTVVPAWGGVERVDGKGTVKGRKRPSGQRVTRYSVVNKDTGAFFSALLAKQARIIAKNVLQIGGASNLPPHAPYLLALRDFIRWVSADRRDFRRLTIDKIRRHVKTAERRSQ